MHATNTPVPRRHQPGDKLNDYTVVKYEIEYDAKLNRNVIQWTIECLCGSRRTAQSNELRQVTRCARCARTYQANGKSMQLLRSYQASRRNWTLNPDTSLPSVTKFYYQLPDWDGLQGPLK